MVKGYEVISNLGETQYKKILEIRRNRPMSILNVHWNISYFNINIHVNTNKEKKEKIDTKRLEHSIRMEQELERRRKQMCQYDLYDIMMHFK